MNKIDILVKSSNSSYNTNSNTVVLNVPSVITLHSDRKDISSFRRDQNDLVIKLNNGEEITLKNFFVTDANGQYSDVVFENPNGDVLWWLEQPATQDAQYTEIHGISQLLKTVPPESHLTAWAITGASLLGIGGMLLATSGNSDSKNPNKPNHSDHLPDFNGIGSNDSESVNDSHSPNPPELLALSNDGLTMSGTGKAGCRVTVKDALGSTVATGTVGSEGNFSITLPEAQKNGETLHITLTDGAGNTSAANTVTAPDTTAPSAPADLVLSDDGLALSGTGEASCRVTVQDAGGRTGCHRDGGQRR